MVKHSGAPAIGLVQTLTVVFIVLKLCNVIDWSWVWVLSPFWITLAVGIACGALYILLDR